MLTKSLETALNQPKSSDTHDPLRILTHAWPFPAPYRQLHPGEHQDVIAQLRDELETEHARVHMATRILDTLVDERERLPAQHVHTLCTWVRGFGITESVNA